jgi:hypothetical protein
MKIDTGSLEELKQLCDEFFQKHLSDSEAQEIGQRIVRFLTNAELCFRTHDRDFDVS